mgnify:FL=1|jgi:hypothetical protein
MQKTQSTPLKSSTNKLEHGSATKDSFSSPTMAKRQAAAQNGENVNGSSPAPLQKKLPAASKQDSPYKQTIEGLGQQIEIIPSKLNNKLSEFSWSPILTIFV